MEYYNTNDLQVFNSIGSIPANQWHYVAVVFKATRLDSQTNVTGNFTFYLDTNVPTGFVSGAVISPYGDSLNRTIGVGTHPVGFSSDFFNGLIYEPRVTLGALPSTGLLFNGWSSPTPPTTDLARCGTPSPAPRAALASPSPPRSTARPSR